MRMIFLSGSRMRCRLCNLFVVAVAFALIVSPCFAANDDKKDKDKDKDKDDAAATTQEHSTTKPTTKPTGKKPAEPAVELPQALTDAITKLKEEYDAATAKDSQEILRDKCDYFGKENPAQGVTQEQVLAALEKNLAGKGDKDKTAKADAYIKWQLLSAIPGKFDDAHVPKALAAYKNAPKPAPRKGASASERAMMDKEARARVKKAEDAIIFNDKYADLLEKSEEGNRPLVEYRDQLFDRLPITGEVIAAGFDDLADRLSSGADADEFLETVCGAARTWALSGDAKANDLNKVAGVATKMQKMKAPGYYSRVDFEKGQAKWNVVEPSKTELEPLITLLKERAKSPKGGYNFKE